MGTVSIAPLDVNTYERDGVFRGLVGAVEGVACEALEYLINGVLDDEVTHGLQREPGAPREDSGEATVPWACHRCGQTCAREMKRNGHYPRDLQTTRGALVGLRVPMVRCLQCGAAANIEFAALRKHKQLWLDVEAEVLFAYGAEEGLRHIAQRVGKQLGWPVSASTIQARVHSFSEALAQWRNSTIADPPDVLMLDGIWFTAMAPTGEYTTDRQGRQRPVMQRVKRVAIIALGLWSDSGRKQIVDFEIVDSEEESNCLPLLNRLHLRGVTDAHLQLIVSDGAGGLCAAIETVYPTTARQRCVFHKLKNVGDSLRDKGSRKAILEAACWIYESADARQAHERLERFAEDWQAVEPEAVASLRTDFDASIAYLRPLNVKHPRRYRTTNAMEGGVMRPLRRNLDRATAYHSDTGANVAIFLAIARLNAKQRGKPWVHETDDLITMLYNAGP